MSAVEGGIGIAGDHRQREDLEDRRVGEGKMMVEYVVVAFPHQKIARVAEPNHLLDLWIGSDESGAKKFGGHGCNELGVVDIAILIDPVDSVGVDIIAIVTEFIGDVQNDQQTDPQAGSEADDVEDGKALAFPKAAKCNLEIVAEHGMVVL